MSTYLGISLEILTIICALLPQPHLINGQFNELIICNLHGPLSSNQTTIINKSIEIKWTQIIKFHGNAFDNSIWNEVEVAQRQLYQENDL